MINCFDGIPEDNEPSFPCPACKEGDIVYVTETELWECNGCPWTEVNPIEKAP